MFTTLLPMPGDSNNDLLRKITEALGGELTRGDSENMLLRKIATVVAGVNSSTAAVKTITTAATTVYVDSTTGSDDNDGSSPTSAFLTPQAAIDYVSANFLVTADGPITIQLADGTYNLSEALTMRNYDGGGRIAIQGNMTTPASVDLVAGFASTPIVQATRQSGGYTLQGVRLTGNSANTGIAVGNASSFNITTITFGANLGSHILVSPLGQIAISGDLTIAGGGTHFIRCEQSSVVFFSATLTVTLTGTPNFTTGFVVASGASVVTCQASAITFSGAATGKRYDISLNAVANTFGGGANYFPGDVAGTTATGGQYA